MSVGPRAASQSDACGLSISRDWMRLMKAEPENTTERVNCIIRNTCRTLMTRGMKGCFVYCVDPALGEYFKRRLAACEALQRSGGDFQKRALDRPEIGHRSDLQSVG